ncbi:hypothetical protein ACFLUU_01470 [Chloroflexota bacterium]
MVEALIILEWYYEITEGEHTHARTEEQHQHEKKGIFESKDGKKYIGEPRPNIALGGQFTVEYSASDADKEFIPIGKWIS